MVWSPSNVEQVAVDLGATSSKSWSIPWSWYCIGAFVVYVYVKINSTTRTKPTKPIPPRLSQPPPTLPRRASRPSLIAVPNRPSSQLSHRRNSGASFNSPRPSFSNPYNPPSINANSGRNSPMRAGFRERKALKVPGSPARSNYGSERGFEVDAPGAFFPPASAPPTTSFPHSPSLPTLNRQPSRPTLPRSNSILSSTFSPAPTAPRRRVTEGAPPILVYPSSARKRSSRQVEDDAAAGYGRPGKRWKHDSDSEMELELDELVEKRELAGRRGVKRSGSAVESMDSIKRSRGDEESEMEGEEERFESPRKRRERSPGAEEMEREVREEGTKRAKAGLRAKPSSKRDYDDAEISSEDGEVVEERRGPRNADSDVDEDEEADLLRAEELASPAKRGRKDGKRARSIETRTASDDEDVMDGTLGEAPLPSSSKVLSASPKKRTLPTPKSKPKIAGGTPAKKGKGLRQSVVKERAIGEEWTNLEGDKYKIDEEGVQRRLCEVRELRRKWKMPKDSKHPDRDVLHEVIVEKWLTDAEFEQALKARKLGWQVPLEEELKKQETPATGDADMSVADEPAPKEKGPFYATGTGTPLRTHSNLSQSSLGSRRTSLTASPSYSTLVNGRIRLPSTVAAGSPARTWSHGKANRIVLDEVKAKEERERRRKASIMLGGEAEEPVATAEPEKLKFADYSSDGKLLASTAPTALPALEAAPAVTPAPAVPSFFSAPVAPTSTTTPSVKEEEKKKPAEPAKLPNFFGSVESKPAAPPASTSTAAASPFSFGAPPASKPAEEEKPAPSFAPVVTSAPATSAPAPFSFGVPPANKDKDAAKPAASPFSFGSLTSSSAPAPAIEPKPAAAAATPAAPKPAAPSPFSFVFAMGSGDEAGGAPRRKVRGLPGRR
ncbi:hypothetical protein MNV49_006185 [Pseudohyphozyma bogoriensis]|nr:hypothetical protein MNV49_006185 [Pseudohyphozyma bogoriensis]